MTPGRVIAYVLITAGVALVAALVAAVMIVSDDMRALLISLQVVSAVVILVIAGIVLGQQIAAPLAHLDGETKLAADAKSTVRIDPAFYRYLGHLPQAIRELAEQFHRSRAVVDEAIATATARAEEQKSRLEALLRDLSEGVIVCNLNHEILLYNHMAVRILGGAADFGLGRALFRFVTREPVLHVLEWLTDRPDRSLSGSPGSAGDFVCATPDARLLLQGRMSLIVDDRNAVVGYVLTLADATQRIAALNKRDTLLRAAIEGVRGPIANLRAAAETLAAHPGMPTNQRGAFETIVVSESARLSDTLATLARDHRELVGDTAAMGDFYSSDLFNCVIRRVHDREGVPVTMTGLPQWMHGDSFALMVMLADLIGRIRRHARIAGFDIEARPGERGCYIDIVWPGDPLPSTLLSAWVDSPLGGDLSGLSLREVLERHHSDLWSQPDRTGHARLRIPLPRATKAVIERQAESLPSRPEFYDFDLLRRAGAPIELGRRPLRSLTFVVFDTETTGLNPIDDRIVSIAAVRIVNGRILTGETFERLINPGRPIPKTSTQIHHITDEQVRDRPPIAVVLPQFKAFVGDAVLVAHNIAFDLSFLKTQENACGVRFDNPVLDTMLLSATLYEHTDDHTLDGLTRRFGIEIRDRHTALGDSIATAAAMVAMFDALERRGIVTLADAERAARIVVELRARQAQFASAARV